MNDARAARRFLDAGPLQLDEVRACVTAIETHARRALDVIQRIRSSLRTEPGAPVVLDLSDAARQAGRLVSGWAADRAVQLEVQTARRPLEIKGDPVQIQQVILNLLLNAVDASAGQPPERRRVSLRTEAGTATAMVTVRDWGDGIADGGRLFEPFYTTKAGGLGLGLSISQTIVAAHGGAISGGPGDGPGALFRVELPLATAERVNVQEATS